MKYAQPIVFVDRKDCLILSAGQFLGAGRFEVFLCLCWQSVPALQWSHQCLLNPFQTQINDLHYYRGCIRGNSLPQNWGSPATRCAAGRPAKLVRPAHGSGDAFYIAVMQSRPGFLSKKTRVQIVQDGETADEYPLALPQQEPAR